MLTFRFGEPLIFTYTMVFLLALRSFFKIYKPFINLKSREEELMFQKLRKELDDARITSLQSRMTPHFMGNLLNLAHARLYGGQPEMAAEILKRVGLLSKMSFEISNHPLIKLENEIDFLRSYLEACRLLVPFNYEIIIHESLDEDDLSYFELPIFLIQPYLENSVIHGIKSRQDQDGRIIMTFRKNNDNELLVSISDNGIVQDLDSMENPHRISSTQINEQRLELFAKQYGRKSRVSAKKYIHGEGSYVEIII